MTDINWDGLVDELGDSPAVRLRQALDEADKMLSIVIIYELKGTQHHTEFGYTTGLAPGGAQSSHLGLVTWLQHELLLASEE